MPLWKLMLVMLSTRIWIMPVSSAGEIRCDLVDALGA